MARIVLRFLPVDGTRDSGMERGWRVYAPLGAIVLLVLVVLALDLVIGRAVASRTNDMVEDAMRSIELVRGLRDKAAQLAAPDLPPERLRSLTDQLTADTQAYDPLARYEGEREEWGRLRDALARLRHDVEAGNRPRTAAQVAEIGECVDQLVAINRRAAKRLAGEIRASQWHAGLIDLAIGLVTMILIVGIGVARHRARGRERQLQAENLALVQERNRELDAFAGRAAHDLRAPLNPIRGYADLIVLGTESPDETRRMASKIRVAVDRMTHVVDDMLELARSGQPAPGRASVAEVCAEVLEELAPELQKARCSTTVTATSVAVAPGALRQIVHNLVGNAVKYRSPERPLEIAIAAHVADDQVVIQIADNGVGMDPESARHAFEPFYRARRDVSGHGLGLAIVERIVRGVGGSCDLSAEPAHGTRVTVRLPRA